MVMVVVVVLCVVCVCGRGLCVLGCHSVHSFVDEWIFVKEGKYWLLPASPIQVWRLFTSHLSLTFSRPLFPFSLILPTHPPLLFSSCITVALTIHSHTNKHKQNKTRNTQCDFIICSCAGKWMVATRNYFIIIFTSWAVISSRAPNPLFFLCYLSRRGN